MGNPKVQATECWACRPPVSSTLHTAHDAESLHRRLLVLQPVNNRTCSSWQKLLVLPCAYKGPQIALAKVWRKSEVNSPTCFRHGLRVSEVQPFIPSILLSAEISGFSNSACSHARHA